MRTPVNQNPKYIEINAYQGEPIIQKCDVEAALQKLISHQEEEK